MLEHLGSMSHHDCQSAPCLLYLSASLLETSCCSRQVPNFPELGCCSRLRVCKLRVYYGLQAPSRKQACAANVQGQAPGRGAVMVPKTRDSLMAWDRVCKAFQPVGVHARCQHDTPRQSHLCPLLLPFQEQMQHNRWLVPLVVVLVIAGGNRIMDERAAAALTKAQQVRSPLYQLRGAAGWSMCMRSAQQALAVSASGVNTRGQRWAAPYTRR